LWIAAWGLYLAYLARIGLDLINFGGGLSDIFWYELLTTLSGLAAGVLALAGWPVWRWLALASSVVFIGIVYHLLGTQPGTWLEIFGWLRQYEPLRLFHVAVMPVVAAMLGLIAAWGIVRRLAVKTA